MGWGTTCNSVVSRKLNPHENFQIYHTRIALWFVATQQTHLHTGKVSSTYSIFLTSNKENKNSLHVGALMRAMSSVTWKDVVDLDEIYLRNACKSPASNTPYLTLRSSHCRSTCRPAHITPNFFFCVWLKLAVIRYSAVYPIAMTTCKLTRQDLLLESIQTFVRCSHLLSRLRTDFTRHFVCYCNTCLFSVLVHTTQPLSMLVPTALFDQTSRIVNA